MKSYLTIDVLQKRFHILKDWIASNVFIWENLVHLLVQISVLLGAWIVGTLLGRWIRKIIDSRIKESSFKSRHASGFLTRLSKLLPLIFSVFVLWLCIQGVKSIGYQTLLLELALNLSIAWIIIQLVTSVILDRFWSKIIALVCWLLAALNIIGFLDRTISLLESIGFTVGDVKLTLLSIIKAVV
ncbi:MAG: hypothetical protein LJE96_23220, partial [Deltaproteobacteria bacterium]|nr:hypothetical protein [Deltaproteobacteria bacterium]